MKVFDIVRIIESEQFDENDVELVFIALQRKQALLAGSMRAKVDFFLGACLNLKSVSLDSVAESFCMSSRTLHRRLRKEDICFSKLIDEERKRRCCYCLLDGHVISGVKIACLLGFTDPAYFYQKFENWTGYRFSEVKRSLAENPRNIVGIFDVHSEHKKIV